MRRSGVSSILLAVIALAAGGLRAAAGVPKVLHSFGIGRGGNNLYGGLILDAAGNLYGVAESGGRYGQGVVFELSPGSGGGWTETVLYSFRGGQDGASPHATLAWDVAGNLYGTTVSGGGTACGRGCGVVFRLTPAGGEWTESVLHQFMGGADGQVPYPGVAVDAAGKVYGGTTGGGAGGLGTVYRLAPNSAGGWDYTVLHSFTGRPDGATLYATPVLDAAGNVYGTTYAGGAHNQGAVFAITPAANGGWMEHILYGFQGGADGANPMAPVTFGQHGTLYGTTEAGGSANCGTAYRLARDQAGAWHETLLHAFLGILAQDGENPNGLILDAHGNLYGTSLGGGVDNPGTIFELSPNPDGSWTETVLYSFTGGLDGAYPSAGLAMDAAGNFYGTTLWGGPSGDTTGGVAFEYAR